MGEFATFEVAATWRVTHVRQITASSRKELDERFCAELVNDGILADEEEFAYLRDREDFSMRLDFIESDRETG